VYTPLLHLHATLAEGSLWLTTYCAIAYNYRYINNPSNLKISPIMTSSSPAYLFTLLLKSHTPQLQPTAPPSTPTQTARLCAILKPNRRQYTNGFRVNNSTITTPAHANGENIHRPHVSLQHSKTYNPLSRVTTTCEQSKWRSS
jgi:hypothetical protein